MPQIKCHCRKEFEWDFPDRVDLEREPESYRSIRDGSFMSATCPHCGAVIKPEKELYLFDEKRGLSLTLIPERERVAFLTGKKKVQAERVVIGYRELAEKIAITENELNEKAVEVIKFLFLQKSENGQLTIYFQELEEGRLLFHLHGLSRDEIGVTRVSEETYRNIVNELPRYERDPDFRSFLTPPYISVNNIYVEE